MSYGYQQQQQGYQQQQPIGFQQQQPYGYQQPQNQVVIVEQQPVYQPMMMQPAMMQQPGQIIVINNTGGEQQRYQPSDDFQASFCGCFEDIGSCITALFCPCIQYGNNNNDITNEGCFMPACGYFWLHLCRMQWCVGMGFRGRLRQKFNINENNMSDCCAYFLCPCCAISQESREILLRRKESEAGGFAF